MISAKAVGSTDLIGNSGVEKKLSWRWCQVGILAPALVRGRGVTKGGGSCFSSEVI